MPPRELQNPFLVHKLDAADRLPAGDVPELHSGVLARCETNIDQTRQAGHSLGLLIVGEAGSGKSHMIARLRGKLANDPQAVLASIALKGAFAGRLWRHVRKQLVSELLREYPSETKVANGLLRILRNRFPKWASPAQGGGLLDWLIGKSKTVGSLQPHLEAFAKNKDLDYAFLKVLPKVGDSELSQLARMWLRGDALGADDLNRLGLSPASLTDLDQELSSREIVLALLELAGSSTTVVICFDEVEALQAGTYDAMSLRQFATLASDLLAMAGPRVVITFIRPQLQLEMQKSVEFANLQRIAQDRASIPPLTWEQSVRVVRTRLETEMSCRLARQDHPADPDWPLGHAFLEKTYHDNRRDLTPRHLIMACRNEFDRLQRPMDEASPTPLEPRPDSRAIAPARTRVDDPPPPPQNALNRAWDKKRQGLLARLQSIPFDQVMAIGIPWLAEDASLPYERADDIPHGLGDVNLLFHSRARTTKPLGICFCNHEPSSLWQKLDRIKKQWAATKARQVDSLVILRYQGQRTTPKGQERFDSLSGAGVRIVLVYAQQLAELAAYQQMLTKTHDGDIVIDGKPIEVEFYDEWARKHLTSAVKELLDVVFESEGKDAVPTKRGKISASRI